MVAREAMAYGRAVVVTAVGGLVDAVEDGVTGILVAPRSSRLLRRAIEQLLENPAQRVALGRAARQRCIERVGWESMARELRKVYGEAVTEM